MLDIAGVVLLFRFGLPSKMPRIGALLLEGKMDRKAVRRFRVGAHTGLVLLIFGFTLQLIGAVVG